MRLNLGCCDRILDGYTNVDIVDGPGVDAVCDLLQHPWPWATSSISRIRAHDIIEHLPDKIATMNELHRVLEPGAEVDILVPTTDGRGAWQDPTHVSFWNRNSFWYFTVGNAHHTRFAEHYGITAAFHVVSAEQIDAGDFVSVLRIVLAAEKR